MPIDPRRPTIGGHDERVWQELADLRRQINELRPMVSGGIQRDSSRLLLPITLGQAVGIPFALVPEVPPLRLEVPSDDAVILYGWTGAGKFASDPDGYTTLAASFSVDGVQTTGGFGLSLTRGRFTGTSGGGLNWAWSSAYDATSDEQWNDGLQRNVIAYPADELGGPGSYQIDLVRQTRAMTNFTFKHFAVVI